MPEYTHAYIARSKCGHVTAIAVDCGDKTTADDVAEWIQDGRTVQRLPLKEANALWLESGGEHIRVCRPKQGTLLKEGGK